MQELAEKKTDHFMGSVLMNSRRGFWLRFAGSAVIATVVVIGAVVFGIGYYEPEFVDPATATLQAVALVDARDPELKKLLAEAGIEVPVRQPPPPPVVLPEREISGFVQIAYTVNPDGSTSNVRVLGAVPRGYYEQQAVREISQRMHSPGYENGEAVAREMETVIEFTVPANSPRQIDEAAD